MRDAVGVAVFDRPDELPEKVAGLVLAQEQARMLGVLPPLGDVPRQRPARRVLHDQGQVRFGEEGRLGVHDVDVALP